MNLINLVTTPNGDLGVKIDTPAKVVRMTMETFMDYSAYTDVCTQQGIEPLTPKPWIKMATQIRNTAQAIPTLRRVVI